MNHFRKDVVNLLMFLILNKMSRSFCYLFRRLLLHQRIFFNDFWQRGKLIFSDDELAFILNYLEYAFQHIIWNLTFNGRLHFNVKIFNLGVKLRTVSWKTYRTRAWSFAFTTRPGPPCWGRSTPSWTDRRDISSTKLFSSTTLPTCVSYIRT